MIEINICCSATTENLPYLTHMVEQTLLQEIVEEHREIAFAIHEALINAVEAVRRDHTYNVGFLTLHLKITEQEVYVSVTNSGSAYSRYEAEYMLNQDMLQVLHQDCGRGFLFMQALMDEICIENLDNRKAFSVIMRKFRKKKEG
ncbi:ATP-binding protein [Heliorestis convoluta]|uniref:ATP-binding protein n=1 Tax=Heliorestis convoluta TaxID=356322 RepID=UPI00129B0559|nr:ATP-binding protein [Heliorestis convoluta]